MIRNKDGGIRADLVVAIALAIGAALLIAAIAATDKGNVVLRESAAQHQPQAPERGGYESGGGLADTISVALAIAIPILIIGLAIWHDGKALAAAAIAFAAGVFAFGNPSAGVYAAAFAVILASNAILLWIKWASLRDTFAFWGAAALYGLAYSPYQAGLINWLDLDRAGIACIDERCGLVDLSQRLIVQPTPLLDVPVFAFGFAIISSAVFIFAAALGIRLAYWAWLKWNGAGQANTAPSRPIAQAFRLGK